MPHRLLLLHSVPAGASGPYLSDTFTDADTTTLAAHTMDVGPGWSGDNTVFAIAGNRASNPATVLGQVYADAGASNGVTASVTMNFGTSGGDIYLVFRRTDASNLWALGLDKSNSLMQLLERSAGSFTQRASAAFAPANSTDYLIEVRLSGTTLDCYRDGVLIFSYTSAANQAATGFGLLTGTAQAGHRWDAFLVEDS